MKIKLKSSRWYLYVIPGSALLIGGLFLLGIIFGTPADPLYSAP